MAASVTIQSELLNAKELAAHLGRHPSYICAMKAIGFRFDVGNRCTKTHAVNWLKDHPNFVSTGYRHGSPEFVKSKTHRPRPRPATADK